MPNYLSEDNLEKAAVELLTGRLGYRTLDCHTADVDDLADGSDRTSKQEVVFAALLRDRMAALNPDVPEDVRDMALEQVLAGRAALSPLQANKAVYGMIRDGVPVEYENSEGRREKATLRLIDFERPEANDFCAVTQLWIRGDRFPRRPDILIYVNGLPLVFIELKNSNVKVKCAYDENVTNYRRDIPRLFQFNAFCLLSNGVETKVGSSTATYDFFFSWLRPDDETEKVDRKAIARDAASLERALLGLFPKERLLDYVRNFILYHKDSAKIIAQNHQFLGVNKAIASFEDREARKGRLGVFWHTQGSGKSFSMIFLARKIFHLYTGNYTVVVVTDREDLDGQIYRNFLDTGTVKKEDAAQPKDSEKLREYLGSNKRLIFTLIQKFRYDRGREYPLLSERKDIIVIVDEAHRTQYAALAENMRRGLPNAQYFAFTGTPLLGRERKTNAWFGDYVSEYNFVQSIDDGATVPLFYQKRRPEVHIQNDNLGPEFYEVLEDAGVDAKAQEKLENEFAREVEVIKREDRLEIIARDIVEHLPRRGYLGKAMVVSVDKFTSVRMFDKVQAHWKEAIRQLVGDINREGDPVVKDRLQRRRAWMQAVEMAVVLSEEAGEDEKFEAQKLDIKPHRKQMAALDANGHDIEYRFKDPEDPLQVVFVCAMWLTGFDAPTVSTLYLDKPMQGHTLMQTIARANRVTPHLIHGIQKRNGEVIDYYNVFDKMKRALSDYALGNEKEGEDKEEEPVQDKACLFDLLDEAVGECARFCANLGIPLEDILAAGKVFGKVALFDAYADKLFERDEAWKEFKVYENTVSSLYEACKPEILASRSRPLVDVIRYLRGVAENAIGEVDIEVVRRRIGDLLDASIVATGNPAQVGDSDPGYKAVTAGRRIDLSKFDFEHLKQEFAQAEYKNIEIVRMRDFIEKKLEQMLRENSARTAFAERLQAIVNRYNADTPANENYFSDLLDFAQSLEVEDERHIKENLSKDELEIYDILRKENLTKAEEVKVKNAAKHLLKRLLEEHPKVLVQDWHRDRTTQLRVQHAIEEVLDADLPETYEKELFQKKSKTLFDLIYDYASKGLKWAA